MGMTTAESIELSSIKSNLEMTNKLLLDIRYLIKEQIILDHKLSIKEIMELNRDDEWKKTK